MRDGIYKSLPLGRGWKSLLRSCEREKERGETACVKAQGFELLKIPMHAIPPRIAELDRDQPIAVLCHHGSRSMQVAAFLVQQGFGHVANITGGINAWSSQVDASVPTY